MRVMSASLYRPTIGLEIHAELKTRTKMFCDSANNPEEEHANVNICPVCLAHPGTLPTINKQAVEHVLRIGAAVNGTLADYTEFDRKSYFYPDIPKGYQISQYEHPLVTGGTLHGVSITRIHLEEDTARSTHHDGKSLVDFNRAGVPLMELVTDPVIHDAKTAGDFARELQLVLRALGAGDANLEKGEMRVEANISVSKDDTLGTKVEVKNLNSFKAVERAIEYEVKRHIEVLESGGNVLQETRGWNEDKSETFSQRLKEGSADYRYFPEPDLPKLVLSEIDDWKKETLSKTLPELPSEKRERLISEGLSKDAVDILMQEAAYHDFYENEIKKMNDDTSRMAALNLLLGEVRAKGMELAAFQNLGDALLYVAPLYVSGSLSSTNAKAVVSLALKTGEDPRTLVEKGGYLQVNDEDTLRKAVVGALEEHKTVAEDYRGGKGSALQFLIGAVMKATKGSGNPAIIRKMLEEELG